MEKQEKWIALCQANVVLWDLSQQNSRFWCKNVGFFPHLAPVLDLDLCLYVLPFKFNGIHFFFVVERSLLHFFVFILLYYTFNLGFKKKTD